MIVRRLSMLMTLVVCVAVMSGCALLEPQQTIQEVQQHPSENVTLIQTIQEPPGEPVYWYCTPEGDDLVCNASCGEDIQCPDQPALVRADRSPAAQQPGPATEVVQQQVDDQPADDEPEDDELAEGELADEETAEEVDAEDLEEEQ